MNLSRPARGIPLLVAIILTLLNVFKPVTVDDPASLGQAARWAAHPSQPLGGEALLYQHLVPAVQVASAPVAIGWLAIGMWVLGQEPWALKLWLFPFAWLLCWALAALLRRLAPQLATPLLMLVVFSPALLPSFNFMLDLPALALALVALEVMVASKSARSAIAAGMLAGLALQTKYPVAPILVAIAAFAMVSGRLRHGALAIAVACGVFGGIEALLFATAGTSPLLEYLASRATRDPGGHFPLVTAKRLVLIAGGAGAALVPLALVALGARRAVVRVVLATILAGFALLAFAPAPLIAFLDGVTAGRIVNFDNITIAWLGPALLVLAALVVWRVVRDDRAAESHALHAALVAWLCAECALAPFISASGSVRRTLGAVVALSLLIASRLPRAIEQDPWRRREIAFIAAAGVLLALVVWAADIDSALAERRMLALALQRTGGAAPQGQVAYVGDHWGAFQYAAARAGLKRVSADRDELAAGDWVIVAPTVEMRGVELDPTRVALTDSVPLVHRLPLTTQAAFYDGRQVMRRVPANERGARIYRVIGSGVVVRTKASTR